MYYKYWIAIKLFLNYITPFLPSCPRIGELEDSDCIVIQAFGRNKFSDKKLVRKISGLFKKFKTNKEVFRQLRNKGFDPGQANYVLADEALYLSKKYSIPIIAQWEAAYCIWDIENQTTNFNVDCIWASEPYYTTWHLLSESRERMLERGLKKPIIVCHPAMTVRVVAIAFKLGLDIIVQGVNAFSFPKHSSWVWDKKSIQPWTRRFFSFNLCKCWLPRESLARVHHIFIEKWVSFFPPK